MIDTPVAPKPMSTAELMKLDNRELILMVGKDGSGKSCAIVSIASWVQQVLDPKATFYVVDTENKFPTALKSFGAEAPTNIVYYKAESMNHATDAMGDIMAKRKPGDWCAVESMGRLWEKAQDIAYSAVSGYDKASYLEIRRTKMKAAPITPKPDDFWNIAKGAHDGAFLELLSQARSLNVVLSTAVGKEKADRFKKVGDTRDNIKVEFGIDMNIEGAPRLPYYAETLVVMGMQGSKGTCRVVRDNYTAKRYEFEIDGHTMWAPMFFSNCRG